MTDLARAPVVGTGPIDVDLVRRAAAEALGTAFLLLAVVGSGIMASRLSPEDVGLQLLQSAGATAAALVGLILVFGAVSGAHLNPSVTVVDRALGTITTTTAGVYIVAQLVGACLGTIVANLMFDLPAVHIAATQRTGSHLWLSEFVATMGLILVIQGCIRSGRIAAVPFAVGFWIGGAYFFTSSTSFANPAVTVARTLSDTFAGIHPGSVPMFVMAQLGAAAVAVGLVRFLFPRTEEPIP